MSRTLSLWQAILLGAAVLFGITLAALALFAIGSRQWLWSDTFHLQVGVEQIRGVEAGTRVRVQGIEAGVVEAVQPPSAPGDHVVLRLRLDGRLRQLIRADARVQIVSEGMVGGKALEIQPGSPSAPAVADNAMLASQPSSELADVLGQVNQALEALRTEQGTVGKLLRDPEAYAQLVALLQQGQATMASVQQDADALRRLPVLRNYVEDSESLLIRPNCERNRQCFAESELFEPGRAVLTADGRRRLDEIAPWLGGLKHKGSDVVVVAYADPKTANATAARLLTRQQSEAVCAYLKQHQNVQKMGWFSSRKVTALGMGTSSPPVLEKEPLPPSRVEVLVFVPQE